MKDSDFYRLVKIKNYCNEIESFIINENADNFAKNLLLIRAISMSLTQIGELVYKLSEELTDQNPNIAWKQIAGLRHRLVHDYDNINYYAIWNIITVNIPQFKMAIGKILSKEPIRGN